MSSRSLYCSIHCAVSSSITACVEAMDTGKKVEEAARPGMEDARTGVDQFLGMHLTKGPIQRSFGSSISRYIISTEKRNLQTKLRWTLGAMVATEDDGFLRSWKKRYLPFPGPSPALLHSSFSTASSGGLHGKKYAYNIYILLQHLQALRHRRRCVHRFLLVQTIL